MPDPVVVPAEPLPELEVVIDLGDAPSLADFVSCAVALRATCEVGMMIAEAGYIPDSWWPSDVGDLNRQQWTGESFPSDILRVRRTALASPWETVLVVAADRSYVVLYGGVALIAVERILRMIMDWQTHRLELEMRRREIHTEPSENEARVDDVLPGSPVDNGEPETAPDINQAVQRFVYGNDLTEGFRPEVADQYVTHAITLSNHQILRVELQFGRSGADSADENPAP
ncbi:hypothetical protein ACIGMX_06930 [Streptomyces aquilus]|uniref:hypothetical protein n=1 Tax=Streptomyces aquilus TaxID=2548456 RepID=UPI0010475CAD